MHGYIGPPRGNHICRVQWSRIDDVTWP